ncbi:hypothetical protein [Terrimonas pollutisoli]|uniref:hypothetical protein n=1 Tax=Terrimonas pollutisoli TaxID=3034147 RepID=UPI0023ECA367|nr:hypothetical protein [Terrimonas sp. H1YJ31]
MKRLHFAGLLYCSTMLLFFTSCGGGDSKKETTTDSTTAETTTPVAPPEVNTIITTPQNMMIARHKVANFTKWKTSYDEHDSLRLANGIHSYVIGRGVEDSNTVLVAVKIDDLDKAKAFAKDPSLKKAMQKGGVTGTPQFNFVTAIWQDTAVIGAAPRSMTTFTVKDWDAWKKSFDEGKQDREQNGIAVRVVGHDADDNKKVALVTALMDTAKAHAYWKSDALKKRREAGGVTSEPQRFVFRVVQRYY